MQSPSYSSHRSQFHTAPWPNENLKHAVLFLATQNSVLASVTSDYQQPLAQISTTSRDLTEEVCSVNLTERDSSSQCLN